MKQTFIALVAITTLMIMASVMNYYLWFSIYHLGILLN